MILLHRQMRLLLPSSRGRYHRRAVALYPSLLQEGYEELAVRFDEGNGGSGSAPKFPTPHNLLFLLRFWKMTCNPHARAMVEKTLDAMRMGGIC